MDYVCARSFNKDNEGCEVLFETIRYGGHPLAYTEAGGRTDLLSEARCKVV